MIYKGYTIEENEVGYYEAYKDSDELTLYARTLAKLKVEIDELNY